MPTNLGMSALSLRPLVLGTKGLERFKRSFTFTKRRPRYLSPLRVLESTGPVTFNMDLSPAVTRAHNVFHGSKLKRYERSKCATRILKIVIIADGDEEYEFHYILDKARESRLIYYLVQFVGKQEPESRVHAKSRVDSSQKASCRVQEGNEEVALREGRE